MYDDNFNKVGGILILTEHSMNEINTNPTVSSVASGEFAVAWVGQTLWNYYQVFASNGDKIGSEFSTFTSETYPTIAGLPSGDFVYIQQQDSFIIEGQIVDPRGRLVGSEFSINSTSVSTYDGVVGGAALASGRFAVCWVSNLTFPFVQLFDLVTTPTAAPTISPTKSPTTSPTNPTINPTSPIKSPTKSPTTTSPTTKSPTTNSPTQSPTINPTPSSFAYTTQVSSSYRVGIKVVMPYYLVLGICYLFLGGGLFY